MDYKYYINFCLDTISPTILFAIAGVATISAVGCVHLFVSRTLKLAREGREKQPCMKGVVIRSYHGISSVEVCLDLPIPKILNQNEVLIKVVAAGVDPMDLRVTKGYGRSVRSHLMQNNEHFEDGSSIILGRECSGIVLDVGNDVTLVAKGDEVWAVSAYCLSGLMAEFIVVKENQVARKPRNLTFEEAASLPFTAIQACNAIINQACLSPITTKNKRILLVTGNSPVGLFTMQLLKSWGADVTTSVPTAGLPMCHELGVDDVIVYSVTDFEIEFRKRKRFDIVINAIGTIIHQLCVDISSPGGKVVTFTTTPLLSDKFEILLGSFLALALQMLAWIRKLKHGVLTSFWWGNLTYDREYLVKTTTFVEERKVFPIVEMVYDIDDALIPFYQLAKYDNVGKNVIRIARHIEEK